MFFVPIYEFSLTEDVFYLQVLWFCKNGEGGIRTRGRGLYPYDGLANRCLKPLGHLSRCLFSITLLDNRSYCKKIKSQIRKPRQIMQLYSQVEHRTEYCVCC